MNPRSVVKLARNCSGIALEPSEQCRNGSEATLKLLWNCSLN